MGPHKKTAIGVLAILIALPQAGCSLYSATIGNAIRNSTPAPDPNNPSVVRKRARMTQAIAAAFRAIEADTDFAIHMTSTDDRCEEGENDWKVQTGYAHRCRVRVTHFYGMKGDFKAQMIAFERLLSTKGWTLPQSSITETLTRYYDPLCGSRRLQSFSGGTPAHTCSLAQLSKPFERYKKDNLELFIVFADQEAENVNSTARFGTFDRTAFYEARAMFQQITQSYPYALAIAVQGNYFEN